MALPRPYAGATALVTGASSGIGAELARGLARRGHGVTLVARREERLRELAERLRDEHGVRAEWATCDLTDAASRDQLAASLERLGLDIEILVNNAGVGTYQPFAECDRDRELDEVRVNVEAVIDLTARYLPGMVRRGRGAVLVTASTAAFQPLPGNASYAASKAFALSFAEAVHREAGRKGVTVTALAPGPVRTEFQDVNDANEFASRLPKLMWRTPEQVAEAGLQGMEKGRRLVVPGVPNRVLAAIARFSPRPVVLRVMDST